MNDIFRMSMAIPTIAPENKAMLTVEETCGVFSIGEHTLRKLIKRNPQAPYLLHVGTKILIKRAIFEKFIFEQSVLIC